MRAFDFDLQAVSFMLVENAADTEEETGHPVPVAKGIQVGITPDDGRDGSPEVPEREDEIRLVLAGLTRPAFRDQGERIGPFAEGHFVQSVDGDF